MRETSRHHATFLGRRDALACVACLAVGGCSFFVPDTRTSADRAREVEPKCRGISDETNPPISANSVDSVEPAYSYVPGGPNGREAHLRGARIHVRPLPGISRESLTRTLECHEVRVTLGKVQARADDPYSLPDRWLTIDVDSERDAFVVLVRTDDVSDARRVLARARLYASERDPK